MEIGTGRDSCVDRSDGGKLVYGALRKPCDRWFMKLFEGSSSLSESAGLAKEMIDAAAKGQADNPEARVVLSELHDRFLRAGVATSVPVRGGEMDAYYGKSAATFIRKGNALYVEKHDDSNDNWGDRVSEHGGEFGMVHELLMPKCEGKDVPLAALRSGFYLDVGDSRDWIKRAFEDLKAGKVSLEEVRAALRDGCLNEIGRAHDFAKSGRKYKDLLSLDLLGGNSFGRLDEIRLNLERGRDARMYTKYGWPFGVKIPASSVELPRPAFNLDTPGSKIPGINGAQ